MSNIIVKFTGLCGFVPANSIWNQPANAVTVLLPDARSLKVDPNDEPHRTALVFILDNWIGGTGLRDPDLTFSLKGTKMGLCYLDDQELQLGAPSANTLSITVNDGGDGCQNNNLESFYWIAPMAVIQPGTETVNPGCLDPRTVDSSVLTRVLVSEGKLETSRLAAHPNDAVILWEFVPDAGSGHQQVLADEVKATLPLQGQFLVLTPTLLRSGSTPQPLKLDSKGGDITLWIENMPLDDILGIRINSNPQRGPDYDFKHLYRFAKNVPKNQPVPTPKSTCPGSSGPQVASPQCPPSRFAPLS
jgi:hypothetical protein